jgi:hypothetical protein
MTTPGSSPALSPVPLGFLDRHRELAVVAGGGEEELLASDLARRGWHRAYVRDIVAHHHASGARYPD